MKIDKKGLKQSEGQLVISKIEWRKIGRFYALTSIKKAKKLTLTGLRLLTG